MYHQSNVLFMTFKRVLQHTYIYGIVLFLVPTYQSPSEQMTTDVGVMQTMQLEVIIF